MKRVAAVLGLVLLAAMALSAQDVFVKANIPFDFVASGKAMPAGDYQFKHIGENAIEVMNSQTRQAVLVHVLTRLAMTEHPSALVTFDIVGDKHVLESVMPGGTDGYLLAITKGKHTHRVVSAG